MHASQPSSSSLRLDTWNVSPIVALCQALHSAGGLLLQREVPEGVNSMFATYARAAGVPARLSLLG